MARIRYFYPWQASGKDKFANHSFSIERGEGLKVHLWYLGIEPFSQCLMVGHENLRQTKLLDSAPPTGK